MLNLLCETAVTPGFIDIIHVSSEQYQLRRTLDLIPLYSEGEKKPYLPCKLVEPVCYSHVKDSQTGVS